MGGGDGVVTGVSVGVGVEVGVGTGVWVGVGADVGWTCVQPSVKSPGQTMVFSEQKDPVP